MFAVTLITRRMFHRLQELEVVVTHVATLKDFAVVAVTIPTLEDDVCCAVALAVLALLAQSIVEHVTFARRGAKPPPH